MTAGLDPDRTVALNYVPLVQRDAVGALWALDTALGAVVRTTREPMIGQMRMMWWHERLRALDEGERLAEPVLAALASHVLHHGVSGAAMAGLIDGWDVLLDAPMPSTEALALYARERGARLFALTALLLVADGNELAGERWALIDLACRASPGLAATTRAAAMALVPDERGPKALRVLTRCGATRLRRSPAEIGDPLGRLEGLRAILG